VAQKARDVGGDLADAGRSAARAASKTADNVAASAGQTVEGMAQRVREYGPKSGMFGDATETVAGSLEQGGRYLEEQGLTGMANDVTELIKRNPIPALLLGVGLGFMIARLTSSRS
jgi:hypothetical protein